MKKHQLALLPLSIFFIVSCTNQTKKTDIENNSLNQAKSYTSSINETYEVRSPLLLSKDFGQTWKDVSQGLPQEIQVSFMEAKGNEMVIATDNMGVFISENNLTHWNRIGLNLPNQKINALHVDEKTIYVAVYREGIYKSDNEGVTWASMNHDLPNPNVQAILYLGEELFVGTDFGIFRLSKSEESWKSTTVKTQVLSIYEYHGRLVAGTSQGTVISRDKGNSWNWIRTEGAVHYTHNVGKRIVELALSGDLIYTDDWGMSWSEMEYQPRAGSYVYEIVKVGEYLVLSNNYGIHRSEDNGRTWKHIFKTESMGFFDFLVDGDKLYGGTRTWDEYRKRSKIFNE